ncbi:MAG: hypothetical protein ACXAAQ_02385, partial [Candidatus Thorarchaeota archaeon]
MTYLDGPGGNGYGVWTGYMPISAIGSYHDYSIVVADNDYDQDFYIDLEIITINLNVTVNDDDTTAPTYNTISPGGTKTDSSGTFTFNIYDLADVGTGVDNSSILFHFQLGSDTFTKPGVQNGDDFNCSLTSFELFQFGTGSGYWWVTFSDADADRTGDYLETETNHLAMTLVDDEEDAPDVTDPTEGIWAQTDPEWNSETYEFIVNVTVTDINTGDSGISHVEIHYYSSAEWKVSDMEGTGYGTYSYTAIIASGTTFEYFIITFDNDYEWNGDKSFNQSGSVNNPYSISITQSATSYFSQGNLVMESIDAYAFNRTLSYLDIMIAQYRYAIIDFTFAENVSSFVVAVVTDTGTYEFIVDTSERFFVKDLSTYGTIVQSFRLSLESDAVDTAVVWIDDIVFSRNDIPPEYRTHIEIEYTTSIGTTSLIMDEFNLLKWTTGLLSLQYQDEVVTHTTTEIIDWTDDTLILKQSSLNQDVSLIVSISSDGMIDIFTNNTSYEMVFVLSEQMSDYSDSFGILSAIGNDDIIRKPTFAALYNNGYGLGVVALDDESVTTSFEESKIIIDVNVDDNVVLVPLLEKRFELVSGIEIDPNFVVQFVDIDITGLLSGWTGTTETQDTAFFEGEFNEDYAVYEHFNTQGHWIIDNDNKSLSLNTDEALNKTTIEIHSGLMNVTVNADDDTIEETVVFVYNFVSFTAEQYPFLRFAVAGTGDTKVSVKLLSSTDTRFNVLTVKPTEHLTETINIQHILGASADSDIISIELWVEEDDYTVMDNKTVFIDELSIYRINGWELVYNSVTMTSASIAESNGLTLTLRSDKDKQVVLKKTLAYVNATEHRIFQWRERVGYSSNINITAVNSTSSSFTFDDDNTNWAVVTNDIEAAGEGALDIYVTLEAESVVEGELFLDWIRIVAPFDSSHIWESFTDGTWTPQGTQTSTPTVSPPEVPLMFNTAELSPPSDGLNVTYSQEGKTIHHENGTHTWETHIYEQNTWNGTEYVRYIYNPTEKYVKIGGLTIYHNSDGSLSLVGNDSIAIGKLKWYVQAYYGGLWQNISLPNYQFLGFAKTSDEVTGMQRFWGTQGELLLNITFSYLGGFKILAAITNFGVQKVPVRAIWAAQNIRRLSEDGYTLLRDAEDRVRGIDISGLEFTWDDVYSTTPDLAVNTAVDRPNRCAAVIFGNQSSVVAPNETLIIDPTTSWYSADWPLYRMDASWHSTVYTNWPSYVKQEGFTDLWVGYNPANQWYWISHFVMKLPLIIGTPIFSASVGLFTTYAPQSGGIVIFRTDEGIADWPSGCTSLPDISPYTDDGLMFITDGTGHYDTADMTEAVNNQVNNNPDWCTDEDWVQYYYIGFLGAVSSGLWAFEADEAWAGFGSPPRLTVNYGDTPIGPDIDPYSHQPDDYSIYTNDQHVDVNSNTLTVFCEIDNDDESVADVDYRWTDDYFLLEADVKVSGNVDMVYKDTGDIGAIHGEGFYASIPITWGDDDIWPAGSGQYWASDTSMYLWYDVHAYDKVGNPPLDDHHYNLGAIRIYPSSPGLDIDSWPEIEATSFEGEDQYAPWNYLGAGAVEPLTVRSVDSVKVHVEPTDPNGVKWTKIYTFKVRNIGSGWFKFEDIDADGDYMTESPTGHFYESLGTWGESNERYDGVREGWGFFFSAEDDDDNWGWIKSPFAPLPFNWPYWIIEVLDDDPNDWAPGRNKDASSNTIDLLDNNDPSDAITFRAPFYRHDPAEAIPDVYFGYRLFGTSDDYVWVQMTNYVGTYAGKDSTGYFSYTLDLADNGFLEDKFESDEGISRYIEVVFKVVSDENSVNGEDDECTWYWDGDTWEDDWNDVVGGEKSKVADDDSTAPIVTSVDDSDLYDDEMSVLKIHITEYSGINQGSLDTYIKILGADGVYRKYYNPSVVGTAPNLELWFDIEPHSAGYHDCKLQIIDNDGYPSDNEIFYDDTGQIEFKDDDTTGPELDVEYTPGDNVMYNESIIVNIHVYDESTMSPVIEFKYSINYHGWLEGSLTLIVSNSTGDYYSFEIPESKVRYGDGSLALQLLVTTTDGDNDDVEDLIVYPDWSTAIYNPHHILNVIDSTPPDIESFEGPESLGPTVYCDIDNRVWLFAYEEEDASGVEYAYLNYTTDNWATWTISIMSVVNKTLDNEYANATLMGRLPLMVDTSIKYTVICFDAAGNSVGAGSEKNTGTIEDRTAPVFLYSRILGAEPSLNGTLVTKFHERVGESGMDSVDVSFWIGAGSKQTESMEYNPETDTWVFHLPSLGENTQIQYNFTATDNKNNARQTTTLTYYVQAFSASITEDSGDELNLIEDTNRVGHYRTMFRLETEGVYGFVPLYTGAIADFTMWLDGQLIPNGAQIILSPSVHILTVKVESADVNGLWGIRLVNMRSESHSNDGVLSFNMLAPAPSNDDIEVEYTWMKGLLTMANYFTEYEFHDVAYIEGDFEEPWSKMAWEKSSSLVTVASGHDSNTAVTIDTGYSVGWLKYDYPRMVFASGVSFYHSSSQAGVTNLTIAFRMHDKSWYNVSVDLDITQTNIWERYIVSAPHDMIEIVLISLDNSDNPQAFKIDDVALIIREFEYNTWTTFMYDDLSPHNVLGVTEGFVSMDYAASKAASIDVDFGSNLSGVNVTVYYKDTFLQTVNETTSIPVIIEDGINRISLYITTIDATHDSLTITLTDENTGLPIEVMGQGTGLLAVTSESTTVYVPLLSGEWAVESETNVNAVLDDTTNMYLTTTMTFTDDDAIAVFTRNNTEPVDIRSTPVLQALFDVNGTGLEISFKAEVRSASIGETVWVSTDWINITDDYFVTDIPYIASELFNTSASDYDMLYSFQILLRDATDDEIAVEGPQEISVLPAFKSRVGEVCYLERYDFITPYQVHDFETETEEFVLTNNAYHGYGAALINNDELYVPINDFVLDGLSVSFMADSLPDIALWISVNEDTEYNVTLSQNDIQSIAVTSSWTRCNIQLYDVLSKFASANGIESTMVLLGMMLSTDSSIVVDSVEVNTYASISVGIPYWSMGLTWDNQMLGFVVEDINQEITRVPHYSVDYNGVSYSTENTDWYNIISATTSSFDGNVTVIQKAFGHNIHITDTYNIQTSGHITLERVVNEIDDYGLYENEDIMIFQFEMSEMLTDFLIDTSFTPLLEFDSVEFLTHPYYDSMLDIDDAEENVDTNYFSRDMSYIYDIDNSENALYYSNGDTLVLTPAPNTDNMWVEYTSVPTPIDRYLVFSVGSIKNCDGFVNVSGSSQGDSFTYNFTSDGVHSAEISGTWSIASVKIGAANATDEAYLNIDWFGLRNHPTALENSKISEVFDKRYYPDFVEPFYDMDIWNNNASHVDDNNYFHPGILVGNLVLEGSRDTSGATGVLTNYVNTSVNIDVSKYPLLVLDHRVPDDLSSQQLNIYLKIGYVKIDGTSGQLSYPLQESVGSFRKTVNFTETAASGGWVNEIRLEVETGTASQTCNCAFDIRIDRISITEDIEHGGKVYSLTSSESFYDVSDWEIVSGSGTVESLSPSTGRFTPSGTTVYERASPIRLRDSYLEYYNTSSSVDDVEISFRLDDETLLNITGFVGVSGYNRIYLDEFDGYNVESLVLTFGSASGNVQFGYIRIADHTGVYIACDNTGGWSTTGVTVSTDGPTMVVDTSDAQAWDMTYVLSTSIPVDVYDTMGIVYSLEDGASNIPNVALKSGVTQSHSPTTFTNGFIADGEVHVLLFDLDAAFDDSFDTLILSQTSGGYELVLYHIYILSRSDTLQKVGPNTDKYPNVVTERGLFTLQGWSLSADDGFGVEQDVNIPVTIADSLYIEYLTSPDTDNIHGEVYVILDDSTKHVFNLSATSIGDTCIISLDSIKISLLDNNITAVGVTLNWSASTNKFAWMRVNDFEILTTPSVEGSRTTEAFVGDGLIYSLVNDILQKIQTMSVEDYVDTNVDNNGTHSNFNNLKQYSSIDTLTESNTASGSSGITFVGSDAVDSSATQSLSLTVPTGTTTGDLMIVFAHRDEGGRTQDWTTSTSGWTRHHTANPTSGRERVEAMFYKFATSGSETNPQFATNAGANEQASCIIVVYRGVDETTPFDVSIQFNSGSNDATPVNPSITPTNDNGALVVVHMATHDDITADGVSTTPSGLTMRESIYGSSKDHRQHFVADKVDYGTAGIITPTAWTHSATSNAGEWSVYTVALRPTAGPDNYMLDLETTFTSVDTTDVDNAELCIYVDNVDSENITVEIDDGSWVELFSDLNTGWNNVSILTHLSSTMTIRFIDGISSNDSIQSSWTLNCVLIRTEEESTAPVNEESLGAEYDIWTAEGSNMVIIARDDIVYAKINSTMDAVGWDIPDQFNVEDDLAIVRWRYTAATAPTSNSYELLIEHDGVNSTIDLLPSGGSYGTSPWLVNMVQLSGYSNVTALYLNCSYGNMHLDYIAIGIDGFATTGLIPPVSWTGDLAKEFYGHSVSDSGASTINITYSKTDTRVTSYTLLRTNVYTENLTSLYVTLYGVSDTHTPVSSVHQITSFISGWNDILLNVSEITSLMTVVTDVEISGQGTDPLIGVDEMTLKVEALDTSSGADYFEIGTDS